MNTPQSDASAKPETWEQFLATYDGLIDRQFIDRWGNEIWQSNDDDIETADQFFSETQFEAYRSLGEHVCEELAKSESVQVEEWFGELGKRFLSLTNS